MTKTGQLGVLLCSTVLSVTLGRAGHAQAAAALVLEAEGATTPPVRSYAELTDGVPIALSPEARLVFVHYATCRVVTVREGTLTLNAGMYSLVGGTMESEVSLRCPRRVTVRRNGEVIGIILRTAPAPPPLPTSLPFVVVGPTFALVLVGPRADEFSSVRLVKDGVVSVLEARLEARQFRWSPHITPLALDTEYDLILVPNSDTGRPRTVRLRTTATTEDAAVDPPIVISVE